MESDYLKKGKWFCAIEGIAMVDRIYNIYFEEYDEIPRNKRIGDLKMSVVQYRLYCDFEGKPIKRNRFKFSNAAYCSPIGVKMEKTLKKSICNNPKEYESFVKFLKVPKVQIGHVTLNYHLAEVNKDMVVRCVNVIKEKLPSEFTFLEFQQIAKENQLFTYVQNSKNDGCATSTFLKVILIYRFGNNFGKRILFDTIDFEIK